MEVSIEQLEPIETELDNCIKEIELTRIHIIEIQKRVSFLRGLIPEEPEELSDEEKIDNFRKILEDFAKDNNIEITNIPSWTENKIEWMALNDHKCCCDPKHRLCPCEKGAIEAKEAKDHMCLCSVLKS